jgi:cytochrome b involved in lipid metabolism
MNAQEQVSNSSAQTAAASPPPMGEEEFRPKPVPGAEVPRKVPRGTGCSLRDWHNWLMKQPNPHPLSSLPRLTKSAISKHNTPGDLWVVLHGVVYDLTRWQLFHPGGQEIIRMFAGKDVSELNDYYHKWVNIEPLIGVCAVGVYAGE